MDIGTSIRMVKGNEMIEKKYAVGSKSEFSHPYTNKVEETTVINHVQGSGFEGGKIIGIIVQFNDSVIMVTEAAYL